MYNNRGYRYRLLVSFRNHGIFKYSSVPYKCIRKTRVQHNSVTRALYFRFQFEIALITHNTRYTRYLAVLAALSAICFQTSIFVFELRYGIYFVFEMSVCLLGIQPRLIFFIVTSDIRFVGLICLASSKATSETKRYCLASFFAYIW